MSIEWTIRLPYTKPPLSLNDRTHWRKKASITKAIRAHVAAAAAVIPVCDRAAVTLYYVPRDARRRDADNLIPILKAACDGIVDAGVVPDDTPELMTKHMPIICAPDRSDPHLYLIVGTS